MEESSLAHMRSVRETMDGSVTRWRAHAGTGTQTNGQVQPHALACHAQKPNMFQTDASVSVRSTPTSTHGMRPHPGWQDTPGWLARTEFRYHGRDSVPHPPPPHLNGDVARGVVHWPHDEAGEACHCSVDRSVGEQRAVDVVRGVGGNGADHVGGV